MLEIIIQGRIKRFKFSTLFVVILTTLSSDLDAAGNMGTYGIFAQDGSQVTLVSGETYRPKGLSQQGLVSLNKAKDGLTPSRIIGDNITLSRDYRENPNRYDLIRVAGGAQVILTNSDISYTNRSDATIFAGTNAMYAVGQDSLLDISNSNINTIARPFYVGAGATLRLSHVTLNSNESVAASNIGVYDLNSDLFVDNSELTFAGVGGIAISNGASATLSNSKIFINGMTNGNTGAGIHLNWFNNEKGISSSTRADNVLIETKGDNVHSLYMTNHSRAIVDNSQFITHGSGAFGIYANNSKDISQIDKTAIETFGDGGIGVAMYKGAQIELEGGLKDGVQLGSITTHGINAHGLYAKHDNAVTPTTIKASDIDIKIENTGYGVFADSEGSDIQLNNVRLMINGDKAAGLYAKNAGAILYADRVNAEINGYQSMGMHVQDGASARLNQSRLNVAGTDSAGVVFSASSNVMTNSMDITDSVIETQDGYAIKNWGGALDLTLNNSFITGKAQENQGGAIGIMDNGTIQSGPVTIAANSSLINGDIISLSDSSAATVDISLNQASIFSGATAGVNQLSIDSNSQWVMTDDSALTTLSNRGTLSFEAPARGVFKTLTVSGDYIGGGTLIMNTVLADDNSDTDKLIVTGNTSGETGLIINNIGGGGVLTTDGIEVIQVGGRSDGLFTLKNRAVAGVYEYFLHKNKVSDENGNWYLRSELLPEPPVTYPPAEIKPPVVAPTQPENKQNPIYRPEAGSYIANMAAATSLFNLRLEDREGRAENSSMWLRQVGSRTKFRDSSKQLHTSTNRYVIQGGGELVNTQFSEVDRLGLGIMLGYGQASSHTSSNKSRYSSKGDVDGYNAGLYATWYQNANTMDGMYVDSLVNYSWLDAKVQGERLHSEDYNINGYSASLEMGYRLPVYQGENSGVFVTPQAQVIWNGLKADDHTEYNGTRVKSSGSDNIQTRLGMKVSRDGVSDFDKNSDKLFTVYTEANWLHNSQQAGAMLDDVEIKQTGSRNLGELKLGLEGQLSRKLNVWSNVSQQLGDDGYSDTALTLGVKYQF